MYRYIRYIHVHVQCTVGKLPVLQNGMDSFVVENGKRTDTKRIAHGYIERKGPFRFVSRSVPFISFSSVPFRFIAFHSVQRVHAAIVKIQPFALQKLFQDLRRDAQRYPWPSAVQPSCETSPYALFSQSPTRGPVQFN